MLSSYRFTAFGLAVCLVVPAAAADPDLTGYKTLDKATVAAPGRFKATEMKPEPAFLGLAFAAAAKGPLKVEQTAHDSPAARAGVKAGDVLASVDGKAVGNEDAFRDWLADRWPGDRVKLSLRRDGKTVDVTAVLDPISRPVPGGRVRASLGIQVANARTGVIIEQVTPGSPAARAQLKVGEVVLAIDQTELTGPDKLRDALAAKKPGDAVTLALRGRERATRRRCWRTRYRR